MFEQEECIESLKDLRFPWIGRGLKRLVMLFVLVLINGGFLRRLPLSQPSTRLLRIHEWKGFCIEQFRGE